MPLAMDVTSLKEPAAAAWSRRFWRVRPDVILNTTGFALSCRAARRPGAAGRQRLPGAAGRARRRARRRSGAEQHARARAARPGHERGAARDRRAHHDARDRVQGPAGDDPRDRERRRRRIAPVPDRVAFVGRSSPRPGRGCARTPAAERRVALVLANYPTRDGRHRQRRRPRHARQRRRRSCGALASAGYRVADAPADGAALMRALAGGPTNARAGRPHERRRALTARRGTRRVSRRCPRRCARRSTPAGARPRPTRRLEGARFAPARRWRFGKSSSASSRRAATRSTRPRPTTTPTSCRRTATSPSMPGCARRSAPMRWSMSASTAISNGCRARRWRCRERAGRRRRSARCPISIPSSSTIRARARRPSAARPP